MPLPEKPLTRTEQYLSNIAGEDRAIPAKPFTRIEQYLDYIAKNGGGGGGGGGSVTIDPVPTHGSQNAVSSGGVYDSITGLTASDIAIDEPGSKTVTGNPIVIEDADEGYAESLVLDLEPIQDLHGYSKPWVGGAGKNKLNLLLSVLKRRNASGTWDNNNNYTFRGITFSFKINSDGDTIESITVNGTSTNEGVAYIIIAHSSESSSYNMIDGNEYTITNGANQGKVSYYDGTTSNTQDISYTFTYDASKTTANWTIGIAANQTVTNLVFKPMIRLATEADATFEPYSNICPIYPANGRNLLNPDLFFPNTSYGITLTCDENTGSCSFSGTNTVSSAMNVFVTKPQLSNAILLKAGITYYFCGNWEDGHTPSANTPRLDLRKYDGSSEIYAYETNVSGGQYTPAEDVYVRICTRFPIGFTSEGLGFKPVLTTDSNTSFIPYQSINVKREGKNLLPFPNVRNIDITYSGIRVVHNEGDDFYTYLGTATADSVNAWFLGGYNTSERALFLRAGTYYVSGVNLYDLSPGGKNYNGRTGGGYYTISEDRWINGIRAMQAVSEDTYDEKYYPCIIKVDDTSVVPDYEPYISSSLTLPLGQDVYGGTYDVESGELTIDTKRILIDGSQESSDISGSTAQNPYGYTWCLYSIKEQLNVNDFPSKALTNRYTYVEKAHTELLPDEFTTSVTGGNTGITTRFVCSDPSVTNKTTLLAWLANNPIEFVYPLETPITISLTPQQLSLLQAYNIISSDDAGVVNINLSYSILETTVKEKLDELSESDQSIMGSIAPVETGISSANYSVGDYLMLNGVFCKVTSAIATGETIAIGTNVTATTVAAELLSIISQLS